MSRIYYVEPNDVVGKTNNGIPLTPDYSDLCMSFNLVAEVTNRHNLVGNVDTQYIMTWNSKHEENDPHSVGSKVSFLQGSDVQKYNFLTTNYSEFDYQHLLKTTTVEGLGITSVNIQYDSWYMPQVTIEFCDVLGSSLFGREEAIHSYGELTSENVFGVFFTQPYPKFRLQMKGFYGDAVTLQLMCSKFDGKFDSTRGYFTATVSFIGYNYSLLTDIPLNFLIASPYSSYFGRDYWDSKKGSPEWVLSSGQAPPKLFDLLLEIKRTQLNISDDVTDYITVDEGSRVSEIKNAINELEGIGLHYNNLIDTFFGKPESIFPENNYTFVNSVENGLECMYIIPKNQTSLKPISFSNLFISNYKEYFDSIGRYNEKDKIFVNAEDFFNLRQTLYGDGFTIKEIKGKKSDSQWDRLISSYTLHNEKVKKETITSLSYYKFYYGKTLKIIEDRIVTLNREKEDIINKGISKINTTYEAMVSVKPYVGDIMKILFCHLETFIQMVNHCATVIDNNPNNRTANKLGVNPSQVTVINDVNGSSNIIGPFPGVYENNLSETVNNIVNTHTEAWIGDFSPNYEEIKLIKGLYDATQMLNDLSSSILEDKGIVELQGVPVIPSDLLLGNPFKFVSTDITKSVSSFCGYVGNRFAQLSVLNFNGTSDREDRFFRYAGEADAINLYMSVGSILLLNTQILEACISNGGISKTITDVITCNSDGDKYANVSHNNVKYHDFEVNKTKNSKRNPIFSEGVNGYTYNYLSFLKKENKLCFLPIVSNDQMNKKGIYDNDGNVLNVEVQGGDRDVAMLDPFCNVYPIGSYVDEGNVAKYGGNKYSLRLIKDDNSFTSALNTFLLQLDNSEISLQGGEVKLNVQGKSIGDNFIYKLEDISPFWSSKTVSPVIEDKRIRSSVHIYQDYVGINTIKVDDKDHTKFTINKGEEIKETLKGEIGVVYGGSDSNTNNDGGLSYKTCLYLIANEDKSNYITGEFDFKGDDGRNRFFWQTEERLGHLFTSEAYYSFNDTFPYDSNVITELNIPNDNSIKTVHKNRRKAYLMAHTFEFDYIKINEVINKKNIQNKPFLIGLPIGYVWLVGAVLYRKEFNKLIKTKNNTVVDFLHNPNLSSEKNTKRTRNLYYPNDSLTLLTKIKNWGDIEYKMNYSILCLTNKQENVEHLYKIHIDDLLPMKYYDEDVKWLFIKEFINFADNIFPIFSEQLELKDKNSKPFTDVELRLLLDDIRNDKNNKTKYRTYSIGEYYITGNNPKTESLPFVVGGSTYGGGAGATIIGSPSPLYFDTYKDSISNLLYYKDNIIPLNGKYSFIQYYKEKHRLIALIDDNNPVQGLFSDMFKKPVVLLISSNKTNSNTSGREIVSKSLYETYIKNFEIKLKELCGINDTQQNNEIEINKDVARALYTSVKNIWDKWLVGLPNKNSFNVNPFFTENFIFMDSFYKNIFKKFFLNYKKLTDIYLSRRELGSTLYSFLGDVASSHNMMFISMSDFNNIGSEDETEAQQNLEKCFLPIPYHKMSEMSENNKFVFLYTHRPSSTPTKENEDLLDNYNIWDYATNEITPIASKLFNTSDGGTDQITRFGYDVPSFGVAFGRQHNHLFKNINLSMDNPIQTEQSMIVLNDIVNLGASAANKVAFYGQDIYPIFSNYSYTCDIEMMGCAKIAPLMYFQLMNIPMWRGTYMIYNISHSITPGNFVTKFKGMKMSAKALPYNTNFVYSKDGNYGSNTQPVDSNISSTFSEGSTIQSTYPTVYDKNLKDYFNDPNYREGGVDITGVSPNLQSLFNRLFEIIRRMNENKPPEQRYGIVMSHAKRKGSGTSQHITGHAIDLQMAIYGNGFDSKPTKYYNGGNQQPFLVTVMDIICSNFLSEVYQLILEYTNGDLRTDNYGFLVLHVGIRNGHKNSMVYIANNKKGSTKLGLKWEQFKDRVIPEFKYIMSKFYKGGYRDLRKLSTIFSNLNYLSGITQEKLDDWFSIKETAVSDNANMSFEYTPKSLDKCTNDPFFGIGGVWTYGANKIDNNAINMYELACSKLNDKNKAEPVMSEYHKTFKEVYTALKSHGLQEHQVYGVMAHIMGESRFKFDVLNSKSNAAGLFQYLNTSGVFRSIGTRFGSRKQYVQKEEPFGVKYVKSGKCEYNTASDVIKLTAKEQVDLYISQLKYGYEKSVGWDKLISTTNALQALDVCIRFGFGIRTTDLKTYLNGSNGVECKKSYNSKTEFLVKTIPDTIRLLS